MADNKKKSWADIFSAGMSYLSDDDKALFENVKKEYSKLSNVDQKDVIDKTNKIMDNICNIFGINDSEHYHITDEMLSDVKDTCKEKCEKTKACCKDVVDKVSNKIDSNISKEDAVDTVNNIIKNTFDTFGIKNPEKYYIKDDDKVYVKIAKPNGCIELTCADLNTDGCYNECCEECDGVCKNPECDVEGCDCRDNTDADNTIDSPVNSNPERVKLNLAAKKYPTNNTKKEDTVSNKNELFPEMKNPAGSVRKFKDANGDLWEGANPYADSTTASNKRKKFSSSDIKNRLIREAKDTNQNDTTLLVKAFKETLVTKVTSILEDSSTHNYIVHPATAKSPAAVEVTLEDIPSSIRNNIYILSEIEAELKNQYEFADVHINVIDTDDKDFITLAVFMVLE